MLPPGGTLWVGGDCMWSAHENKLQSWERAQKNVADFSPPKKYFCKTLRLEILIIIVSLYLGYVKMCICQTIALIDDYGKLFMAYVLYRFTCVSEVYSIWDVTMNKFCDKLQTERPVLFWFDDYQVVTNG